MDTIDEAKRQAMSAITNVQTVAQMGMIKLTGGIALYVGRIRERDREMAQQNQQQTRRREFRREDLQREP
ncbi:MAG: hypothetical protein WDM80_12755 [Limisphaerales bacterium]